MRCLPWLLLLLLICVWSAPTALADRDVGAPLLSAPRLTRLTPAQRSSVTDVHVIYSNHVDIGFDGIAPLPGYARNVVNQYLTVFFPRAIETAANVSALTQGRQRYVWTTQCWLVSLYLDCPAHMGYKCPSRAEQERVRAAIRAGTIAWHAYAFNVEMELMEPDLLRAGVDLCYGLSDEFGLPRPRTLSQRDVPGMTRAALPVLHDAGVRSMSVGVNGFSASPDFPPASVWRDEASGAEVLLAYHPLGYGGILRPDAIYVEGLSHVLITDWQEDNHGPHSSDDVQFDLHVIQSEFPNANVYASSFDSYFAQLETVRHLLPVVRQESGDTWIWGVGSDPLKLAQFRALQRARARCVADDSCDSQSGAFRNFTRLLLKAAEHTWGGDVKLFLNGTSGGAEHAPNYDGEYFAWSNDAFARVRRSDNVRAMEATWTEQREWGVSIPLSALPASHPLLEDVSREFEQLAQTRRPSTQGYESHDLSSGPVHFKTKHLYFALCPKRGVVLNLTDAATGSMWSSGSRPLGQIIYQTFTEQDYANFRSLYGSCQAKDCAWSLYDFGKRDLDRLAGPKRQDARPAVQGIWSRSTAGAGGADGLSIVVQLKFEEELVRSYGAPAEVWISIDVSAAAEGPAVRGAADAGAAQAEAANAADPVPTLDFRVLLVNKTSTRLPESMWFSFDPLRPWIKEKTTTDAAENDENEEQGWMLHKVASQVRAADVMLNGSQTMHAVWDGATLSGGDSSIPILSLSSPDAALVCVSPPGALSPFPALAPAVHDPLRDALAFNLLNNIWGTNYVMWYPFLDEDKDMLYRFRLQLRGDVPTATDRRVELREELSSLIDQQ